MKSLKHITTGLLLFIAISITAQQSINYKALVKDGGGNLFANQGVTVQFQILQGAVMTNVYQETHAPNTDANGMIIVNIGEGTIDSGDYSTIDWSSDNHFLNVQIDTGSGLIDMGTTQFMAVPYSLSSANNQWTKTGDDIKNVNGGKVTIIGNIPEGDQNNYSDYPLRIEGGNQGLAIKVNGPNPNRDQNYITFFNIADEAQGRIEGSQKNKIILKEIINGILDGADGVTVNNVTYDFTNQSDLQLLRDTYFNNSYTQELLESTIDIALQTLQTTLDATVFGVTAGVWEDPADVIFDLTDLFYAGARYVKLLGPGDSSGVAFESGGADYAEWLKKANPDERIAFGEVVGIKGGLISKTFTDANQFLAVTSNPIIVGGMPEVGSENNFEKVALMGQVPIMVFGKVAMGDYILPSGFGDGNAIAVNPKNMKANDYSKIIGVAWSESDGKNSYNYINTAVGFNANQMGMALNSMQEVINTMQEELVKLNPEFQPVYFDTTKNNAESLEQSNEEFIERMRAYCSECSAFGRESIKCYIKCWINTVTTAELSDIDSNGNAIRAIVKKTKPGVQLVGQNVSVVLEILKLFMEEKILPTIDNLTAALFDPTNGIIDISELDDLPVVQDLLISIRDQTIIETYGGFDNLQNLTDSWTEKLARFRALRK